MAQEQAVAMNIQDMHNGEADDLLVKAAVTLDENEGLSMYFL